MEEHNNKDHTLKTLSSEFNGLRFWDRVSLQTSNTSKAAAKFIVEDSKKHPWKIIAYVGPIPALGIVVGLGTFAWVSLSNKERAIRARGDLKRSFQDRSFNPEIQQFVRFDEDHKIKLAKRKLLWHTTKSVCRDATTEIKKSFKDLKLKK